jgi:hypothetical protein
VTETSPKAGISHNNRFRRLATASWVSPLIAIAANIVLLAIQGEQRGPSNEVQRILGPALILIGLGSGIIALIGMAKAGKRGILLPATIGVLINLTIVAFAVKPVFLAAKPTRLQPVVRNEGGRILKDENLGLTLEVPAGFVDFPAGKALRNADYFFIKGDTNDNELDLLFSIQALAGVLPKQRADTNMLGGNTNATLRGFNWRGMEIDGVVLQENLLGSAFTTYNIHLPTTPRAMVISLGAPSARKAELDQITAALLPSIDAKSDW